MNDRFKQNTTCLLNIIVSTKCKAQILQFKQSVVCSLIDALSSYNTYLCANATVKT